MNVKDDIKEVLREHRGPTALVIAQELGYKDIEEELLDDPYVVEDCRYIAAGIEVEIPAEVISAVLNIFDASRPSEWIRRYDRLSILDPLIANNPEWQLVRAQAQVAANNQLRYARAMPRFIK